MWPRTDPLLPLDVASVTGLTGCVPVDDKWALDGALAHASAQKNTAG